MVVVSCSVSGCPYKTEDVAPEIVVQLLNLHALQHTSTQIPASRGSKLARLTMDIGVEEETWNNFLRR